MDPRSVWILYRHELRGAFRERAIVVNSLLLPIFLYPVLLWLIISAVMLVQGLAEGQSSRIAVVDVPPGHRSVLDSLAAREHLVVQSWDEGGGPAVDALIRGDLDAVLTFEPALGGAGAAGNVGLRIYLDGARDRSTRAARRLEGALAGYRTAWLRREAAELGIAEEARLRFGLMSQNVSDEEQLGTALLRRTIPLFLLVMIALGCLVPAIDTTAGERERSTWETLLTVPVSLSTVVVAKYLFVATLGIAAGLLNVGAILLSIGAVLEPVLREAGQALRFQIPLAGVPVMMAGAVALALFFAAGMMLLASFARTFKEGQAMVTPIYWLALLPMVIGSGAGDEGLTPAMALVPLANVALMIRDAIDGVFHWPWIAVTFFVQLVVVAALLVLARWVLRYENLVLGSVQGGFFRFLARRLRRKPPRGAAPPVEPVRAEPTP